MDTNPRMPMAGFSHSHKDESAAYCVQPDLDSGNGVREQRSGSPTQDRWRQSFRREPGQRFIHAGLVGAPLLPEEYRHGIRTSSGDKAGDCLVPSGPQSELAGFVAQQKERNYRSNVREPLGHGYVRGHRLPEKTLDPTFRFGVSTSQSESAKSVLYNPTRPPHMRSHGSVDAGPLNQSLEEYQRTQQSLTTAAAGSAAGLGRDAGAEEAQQRFFQERLVTRPINREYNWPENVDPARHRFGKVVNANPATSHQTGLAGLLQHSVDTMQRTVVGSKRVEEVKAASFDHLGKGRRQRGALAERDEGEGPATAAGARSGHRSRTFGRPGQHDEWGARDCIRGTYTESEQLPDPDLGKSRFRVTQLEHVPANHLERSFGLPSVRADRRPPAMKSVANDMNFGDESDGKGLLYPSQFAFEGVNEEDFLRERSAESVRIVFRALGLQFPDQQFEQLVTLARQRYGALSVDSFRHCWNQVRLGALCATCGATLCSHEQCAAQACRHDESANHAPNARHVKQQAAREVLPAGFSTLPRTGH